MLRSEQHPSLPPLPKLPAKEMAGPTPWSNWAMPGRVLAGAYPASLDDAETEKILTILLELGVNTFVCLQAEVGYVLLCRSSLHSRPQHRAKESTLLAASSNASIISAVSQFPAGL